MSVDLTEDQINNVLQGISIPPQPQIMVDLQMEQVSPDCSIECISNLISQDVGLSGSILKTVNSSFYGLTNKITSIQQACNLLGINSVVNIVNALSIRSELSDDNVRSLNRFWDSAMDVAMAAASISKQIGFHNPDEAYTLGLFHNCGIPLLMLRFDDFGEALQLAYSQEDSRVIDVGNKSFNTNHAVVGYYVSKSWNLPKYMCEAIADHHSADAIFADLEYANAEKKNLMAVLKMAEHICGLHRTLGNHEVDYEWNRIEEAVLIYVGLSAYDFQSMKEAFQESGLGGSNFFAD